MKISDTPIADVKLISSFHHEDERGSFVKNFSDSLLQLNGISFTLKESYFSNSSKGVIRGLHFQTPPHQHAKIVFISSGLIQDVIVDLRKGSSSYGAHLEFFLNADRPQALYLPPGIAHGFCAVENSTVHYLQSSEHAPCHDNGILYSSINVQWACSTILLSKRDLQFPPLSDFDSPFIFGADC